jgi:signal transduction histidine kinase
MEASTRLLYDEQGQSTGAIFSLRDISERKRTEQLLQTLNTAALAMQKAQSPDQIFSAVAEALNQVGLTSAFFETDPARQRLIPRYVSYNTQLIKTLEKLTGLTFGKFAIPIERVDSYRQTIWERKTIFISSLEELTRQVLPGPISALAAQVLQYLGISHAILSPLIVEDEVIGQFTVQSKDLRPSDIPAITAFSHQMAAAWRQSQLYQQAQQEIHARKQAEDQVRLLNEELEERVAERTEQLQESIHELEAFSYSVSHDLRAPLRAIDGFSSILAEDYDTVLDAEGKRLCAVIRNQTLRMGGLIDDLLTFSRLNRAEIQPTKINMEAIVRAAYNEVTSELEHSHIQLKFGKLPPAQGDSSLIHQVWVNLLSNAVKFSSKCERPIIQVQATRSKNEIIYSVRDNGAGFNMQYSSKLFGVFQRLHTEKEFPGTGVGLAIVQRIIHRHGGRVWAEGKEGQGATFYFSLPLH